MRKQTKFLKIVFLVITNILICQLVKSEVKEIKIEKREVISKYNGYDKFGDYEVLKGTIIFEIDPAKFSNQQIIDLNLAPLNQGGFVEFSADFELHKPLDPTRGNQNLMCFIPNRSSKMGDAVFNYLTGVNWLYKNGWSYLWIGWNCDVPESKNALNIRVPIAKNINKEISGKVYSEIISFSNDLVYTMPIVWGGSLSYEPTDYNQTGAELSYRQYRDAIPELINREKWGFGEIVDGKVIITPGKIYLDEGFKPGWLYDLVYEAKNPKITGLGMAAIRDIVSFLRFSQEDKAGNVNPLAGAIEHTFAWGHSQSARLLNHFISENFNQDEYDRKVFDGVIASCPGAGKGMFNSRFAQFTRHGSHLEDKLYPIDVFPFTSVIQQDPLTGESGSAYQKSKDAGTMPKLLILNSSTDYWTRGASLLHTNVSGTQDHVIDDNVRIYLASGMAHTDNRLGILDRALLVALNRWVCKNELPPPSEIPKISGGTLVSIEQWQKEFPLIPGILLPQSYYMPLRLNRGNYNTNIPPLAGEEYISLVPQVDNDGNDIAGIRLPEIEVPIATNCGWEQRRPGFSNSLRRNAGKDWMFCINEEERSTKKDPRKSIIERYPTKKDYLANYTLALLKLKNKKFLLDEDFVTLSKEVIWLPLWNEMNYNPRIETENLRCQPDTVNPGEECILSICFRSGIENVMHAKVALREASFIQTELAYSGNGNVWEGKIRIPKDAPQGRFNFDFTLLDDNLNQIIFSDKQRKTKRSVSFYIKN